MHTATCPICQGETRLFDVVDFRVSYPQSSLRVPLSGIPVYYAECLRCAFLFAPEFQGWTRQDFAERIYNEDYARFDPDFLEARPRFNAALLSNNFSGADAGIRHMDYGGGAGLASRLLAAAGWNSTSCDPFMDAGEMPASPGKFDLVTAFEVFEHAVDIPRLVADLSALIDDPGMIFFSTLLSDGRLTYGNRIDWWYVSPGTGHLSIHSRRSLELLGARMGLRLASFGEGLHCYFNRIPAWAAHLFVPVAGGADAPAGPRHQPPG